MVNKYSFFESYHNALDSMDDAAYGRLVRAMSRYVFCGELPSLKGIEKMFFDMAKPVLEKSSRISKERSEAGKKGGLKNEAKNKQNESKREAKNKQNESKREAKNKQNESKREADKEKEMDKDKDKEMEYGKDSGEEKKEKETPTPPSSALTSVDTLGAEIKKEEMYIETIAQDISQSKRAVEIAIDEFVTFLKLTDEPMKSRGDFKRHFLYWVRKQDFKKIVEKSLQPTPEEEEEFAAICLRDDRDEDMKRILRTYVKKFGVTPRVAIDEYKRAVKQYHGDLDYVVCISCQGERRLR